MVRCATNGCERSCSSAARPPTSWPKLWQVDAKTVERWITKGRIPYRRHRFEVATFLGRGRVLYLAGRAGPRRGRRGRRKARSSRCTRTGGRCRGTPWDISSPRRSGRSGRWSTRGSSSPRTWECDGCSPSEPGPGRGSGSLLGDPDSPNVAGRGVDEGIGGQVLAAKVRSSLVLFGPLLGEPGVEIRLHETVLYNSIYRADDQLLVNTHCLRGDGQQRADVPPAQDPGRGDGQHLHGELRAGLGRRHAPTRGPGSSGGGSTSTTTRPRPRRTAGFPRSMSWWSTTRATSC